MVKVLHWNGDTGHAPAGVWAVLALAALFAQTSAAQNKECDRACLTAFVDSYFKALFTHDAAALPQAARARITENGSEKPLA